MCLRQALLGTLAQKGFNDMTIGVDAIGPEIVAHHSSDFVCVLSGPGQHRVNGIVFINRLDAVILGFKQWFEETLDDPRIALINSSRMIITRVFRLRIIFDLLRLHRSTYSPSPWAPGRAPESAAKRGPNRRSPEDL